MCVVTVPSRPFKLTRSYVISCIIVKWLLIVLSPFVFLPRPKKSKIDWIVNMFVFFFFLLRFFFMHEELFIGIIYLVLIQIPRRKKERKKEDDFFFTCIRFLFLYCPIPSQSGRRAGWWTGRIVFFVFKYLAREDTVPKFTSPYLFIFELAK